MVTDRLIQQSRSIRSTHDQTKEMIRIQIEKNRNGSYSSFVCKGHADYAKEGSDVVCAGVSALVINTVNCLEDLLGEKISVTFDEEKGGDIECRLLDIPSENASFLIDCMIHGFDWIIGQYGRKYLDYEIKEA